MWATKVPLPGFLGYSFSYSIRVPDGIVLVDLGWDSEEGWATLEFGLSRAAATWGDVVGVVVTHTHPDHFGLVQRVRASTGAWVAGHRGELPNLLDTPERLVLRAGEVQAWLLECGVPSDLMEALENDTQTTASDRSQEAFDFLLEDGAWVPGSNDTLEVLHTPGHTSGSLCLLDHSRRLLFTGDHLLPRVTPNVSKRPGSVEDPVAEHHASLRRVAALGDDLLVLPGHEWPFDRLSDRANEVRTHSIRRGREIVTALGAGPATVWQVAHATTWSRPFDSLDVRGKRQALGETHAHLHHLAAHGGVLARGADAQTWALRAETANESLR